MSMFPFRYSFSSMKKVAETNPFGLTRHRPTSLQRRDDRNNTGCTRAVWVLKRITHPGPGIGL